MRLFKFKKFNHAFNAGVQLYCCLGNKIDLKRPSIEILDCTALGLLII